MESATRKRWGTSIAAQRKFLKLTQRELADQLDVTQAAVSAWETGRAAPDHDLRPRIARALRADVHLLFSYETAAVA